MKKQLFLILSLASMVSLGQEHFCAFDKKQAELEKHFPEMKKNRELIEKRIKNGIEGSLGANNPFSKLSTFSNNNAWAAYKGPIYEVPVVVHIIETNNPKDRKITDEEIQTWVDNTNKMFATTYSGNHFYREGEGVEGGNIIPFKLVLAKRTIDNRPTNGIVRYDGTNFTAYNNYGVALDTRQGATEGEVRRFAPHWSEKHYYNIYVVTAFDNKRSVNDGFVTLGYAYPPTNSDGNYDAFILSSNVIEPHNAILAHEFGHSLGLIHPFHGEGRDGCGNADNVDDTEPIKNLISGRLPSNTDINPCTNQVYQGGQYNVMNYSTAKRKFTQGQRERALDVFLSTRKILTQSLGGKEPTTCTGDELGLTPLVTSISKSNVYGQTYNFGLTRVKLEDIDNEHTGLAIAYTDYTTTVSCMSKGYRTTLREGQTYTMTVTPSINNQAVGVWIDYNDNGKFDNDEVIYSLNSVGPNRGPISFTFSPKTEAVKEKYLRMRVIGDYSGYMSVNRVNYGEVEDYAVRIVPKDWVDPETIIPNDTEGRIGINTEEPKATLDIRAIPMNEFPKGKPQGVLFPTFTTEDRATFQNIPEGTMIFNSDYKCLEIYTNGSWKCLN